MNAARVYVCLLAASVRSQMQYRASFIMLSIGHFLATGIEVIGIWALFARFGTLRGWSLAEVALCYGLINVAFAVADAFARGFDMFAGMVKNGGFDRLLLRPRSAALQVAGQQLFLTRVGRLAQGLLMLIWAVAALGIDLWSWRLGLMVWAGFGAATLFYGLFVLQATMAFWTTESLEVWNAFTYGGNEAAQYPLSIYSGWFRRFFTFVIPLACVTYYPVVAILGRADEASGTGRIFQALAPGVGPVFLLVSLCLWRIGVRHYRSTGS